MFAKVMSKRVAVFKPSNARMLATLGVTITFVAAQALPAFATIDNTATAQGTTGSGAVSGTNPLTNFGGSGKVSVPVQAGAPKLQVSATPAVGTTTTASTGSSVVGSTVTACTVGATCAYSASGNTVTITYTVTNTGNVTINNVLPTDTVGIQVSATPVTTSTFANGTGSMGTTFTYVSGSVSGGATYSAGQVNLPPGGSAQYTATYTLSAQDVYTVAGLTGGTVRSGQSLGATGTPANGTTIVTEVAGTNTNLTGYANLTVVKSAIYDGATATVGNIPATLAAKGDSVKYTYAVTNSGTVTMYNVQAQDVHDQQLTSSTTINTTGTAAGIGSGSLTTSSPTGATASSGAAAANGSWPTLGAGATVTFSWTTTVSQPDIDHG